LEEKSNNPEKVTTPAHVRPDGRHSATNVRVLCQYPPAADHGFWSSKMEERGFFLTISKCCHLSYPSLLFRLEVACLNSYLPPSPTQTPDHKLIPNPSSLSKNFQTPPITSPPHPMFGDVVEAEDLSRNPHRACALSLSLKPHRLIDVSRKNGRKTHKRMPHRTNECSPIK